MTAKPHTS